MKGRMNSSDTGFIGTLKWMQVGLREIEIYKILAKKPMSIRQLVKATRLSERMLRTHLDNLVSKKFIYRELVVGSHIKYVYHGNPEESIYDILVRKLNEFHEMNKKTKGSLYG
ncbi:MAG: hypothetical protein NTY20_05755 [Candidatus Aenigmarchaeota archaeon]|nr:hypothetical protein [Candidatus Aenigmarchaeota archaeon]